MSTLVPLSPNDYLWEEISPSARMGYLKDANGKTLAECTLASALSWKGAVRVKHRVYCPRCGAGPMRDRYGCFMVCPRACSMEDYK